MARILHIWNDEQTAYLREIFPLGSHEWMAGQINQKFGTTLSRNAVIGRCGRIKLFKISEDDFARARSCGHLPRKSGKKRDKKPKPRKTAGPRRTRRDVCGFDEVPRTKDGSAGKHIIKLFDAFAGPNHLGISFIDLEPSHCRFPKGEGAATTYCGQPVLEGKSYCQRCYSICYEPPKPREEKAAA